MAEVRPISKWTRKSLGVSFLVLVAFGAGGYSLSALASEPLLANGFYSPATAGNGTDDGGLRFDATSARLRLPMARRLARAPKQTWESTGHITQLFSKNRLFATLVGLTCLTTCLIISMMMPGGGGDDRPRGGSRQPPPGWSPDREATYPFRHWVQDLLAWSILATEMDPAQQCAAIILQLGGSARELTRSLNYQEMVQGGQINGEQVDPVTYLLTNLATQFAPLGGESRLQATRELFEFSRRRSETTDALLSRFL